MAINLLDSKPIFSDEPPALLGYSGMPSSQLVHWLALYEAGLRDPDPVEGEENRIQLKAATYAADEGLIVEVWGKRYRLRVTAEELGKETQR